VYYDRLELHVEADAETVKVAYRRMARRYHPDLNPSPDATAQMQAINEAYERIMERLEGQQKP
jgi:curved DNA-binding protein